MGTILYIARKQIKNTAVRVARKPARLIAVLASAALIVWMLLDTPARSGGRMDPAVLKSGYLVWLLALGTVTALSALESGSSLFHLPDVNLLFVSPLSPKTVLAYGLIRQTGRTFAGFVFLLFYSGMLIDAFGITALDIVVLIFGTALFLAVVQVAAMCLYCIANRGPAQRAAIKAGILAVPLLMVLFVLYRTRNGLSLTALYREAASPVLDAFPVVGWIRGAVFALIAGNGGKAALFLALAAAFFALMVFLFLRIDADYYEDVLNHAEKNFELRQAAKGKQPVRARPKKPVGKTGIDGGWGASAFFYKHLREDRRGSRFVLVGSSTLVMLLVNFCVAGVITLIGKNGSPDSPNKVLLTGCAFSVYFLFLQNNTGGWSRELSKPYLYLVPEPPFRKLVWAGLSTVLKPAIDGTITFAVLCTVLRANPFMALTCALAYASFGFLFTAGSVLGRRVLGTAPNRGMVMMLFMLLLFLVMAPGIVGTIIVAFVLHGSFLGVGPLLVASPLILWNILAAFLIFYFCRNLLSSCEN